MSDNQVKPEATPVEPVADTPEATQAEETEQPQQAQSECPGDVHHKIKVQSS